MLRLGVKWQLQEDRVLLVFRIGKKPLRWDMWLKGENKNSTIFYKTKFFSKNIFSLGWILHINNNKSALIYFQIDD